MIEYKKFDAETEKANTEHRNAVYGLHQARRDHQASLERLSEAEDRLMRANNHLVALLMHEARTYPQ